ncbi:unnamed protein product [Ambrosiozyma monospora]|uniref:Unnamed protein product n=1 Tax=Ambrosiozyma monospora TaxID=43982 RepID=A0ACB5UC87_AMBMO|nr:unnamed protein product [Ambrosiozyma monospora]
MKEKNILSHVSLSIPKNEILCLVGESGCGKTTLISLLQRYYPVTSGSLKLLGQDINTFNLNSIISNLAIVTQDHYFTETTLRENLLYSNPYKDHISNEIIMRALRQVNLYDFVSSLPEGLQTKLGSSQSSLISGGQAQRFSIARGLLRAAKIYILDECTSSLDPESADNVKELIMELKGEATVILVTHKEELMAIADTLVFMKDGDVSEKGTFDTLMASKGDLWRLVHS